MISFFVHGLPQTQGNLRARPVKGHTVLYETNKKVKGWRQAIAECAQTHAQMFTGPVSVEFVFYLSRPKSLPKRLGTGPLPTGKRPDADKLLRACLDALTGVFWADDGQVADVRVQKFYAATAGPIGVAVTIGGSIAMPERAEAIS